MEPVKRLEMLDIDVTGQEFEGHVFHDMGNVEDIYRVKAIIEKSSLEKRDETRCIRGTCYRVNDGDITHHFWMYQLVPQDISLAVFVRGHEETHALHGSGNLHLLQSRIKSYGNKFDLSKAPKLEDCSYEEREIVADIGGIYALVRNGIHHSVLKSYGDIHPKAFEVFEANMNENTKIVTPAGLLKIVMEMQKNKGK